MNNGLDGPDYILFTAMLIALCYCASYMNDINKNLGKIEYDLSRVTCPIGYTCKAMQ